MNPLNVLYIHSHDTGRYIQPYGYPVATSNLQRLAEQGVLFRQNFCVNPTCSASRSALLTGSYPHNNGMVGLAHRGFALHDYHQHLVQFLRAAGYFCALSGVQHEASRQGHRPAWQVIGYQDQLAEAERAHTAAVHFLQESPPRPFFLSVGFFETHREFPEEGEIADDPRYCLPPPPLPDLPLMRLDMARFKASARRLDHKIGAVLDALDASGLAENTLVICTTDHGMAFPRMKCNLQDSGTGTFLILRGPLAERWRPISGLNGGKVIDAMTSHLDLFPTLCDLLELDPPAWLQGCSLLPLVRGEVEALHETLFFEVNYHAAYEPLRAVRTQRWKYIRRFDGRNRPVLPNCDDSLSKTLWLEQGWADSWQPTELLYDLLIDPNESANLAGDPAFQGVLQEMRARLENWMHETHDPLLLGPVPAPPGAVVNDVNGLSPNDPVRPI